MQTSTDRIVKMCGGELNVTQMRAAVDAKDWQTVMHLCSGLTSHIVVRGIWGCAMTAFYGPLGIHADYKDAQDRPTAETLARFPHVAEAMADAAERINTHYMWRFEKDGAL